jgi:TusA-related sulfurtransferase
MTEAHQTLDARNMACPMPVLKSKKALKSLEVNQVLEILATDPGSMADIPAWTRTTGQELISAEERGPKDYRFLVRRLN